MRHRSFSDVKSSRLWPRPGLDLVVLLCNRVFFVQKSCKIRDFVIFPAMIICCQSLFGTFFIIIIVGLRLEVLASFNITAIFFVDPGSGLPYTINLRACDRSLCAVGRSLVCVTIDRSHNNQHRHRRLKITACSIACHCLRFQCQLFIRITDSQLAKQQTSLYSYESSSKINKKKTKVYVKLQNPN